MVADRKLSRQPSARSPFLLPLWHDNHSDFLRLDALLPAAYHARWLDQSACGR